MKYRKLSLVLVVSLVLLLIASLVLICAWGYTYLYGKDAAVASTPKVLVATTGRDSLQKLYSATLDHLNTPLDSAWNRPDSALRTDAQLEEFHRLKGEISELLKKSSTADLDSARLKIALLQQKIEELRSRTQMMESENKRLTAIVDRLSSQLKTDPSARTATVVTRTTAVSEPAPDAAFSSYFTANDLHLSAINNADAPELNGSLALHGNPSHAGSEEVYIVVLQPDGHVLQSSTWETGAFETREGRKIYSTRIRFDYTRGETRRLNFSLHPEELQKGAYSVQVYHHGVMIGKGEGTVM